MDEWIIQKSGSKGEITIDLRKFIIDTENLLEA